MTRFPCTIHDMAKCECSCIPTQSRINFYFYFYFKMLSHWSEHTIWLCLFGSSIRFSFFASTITFSCVFVYELLSIFPSKDDVMTHTLYGAWCVCLCLMLFYLNWKIYQIASFSVCLTCIYVAFCVFANWITVKKRNWFIMNFCHKIWTQ